MGIAQQYLHALLASQVFFIRAFHAQFTYIVARLVIVVLLNICWRHLGHIAQHMGSVWMLILTDAALLHVEAWKAVHLLLKHTEVVVRELVHEHLLREA